jgi:hypothetical protein
MCLLIFLHHNTPTVFAILIDLHQYFTVNSYKMARINLVSKIDNFLFLAYG